MDRRGVKAGPPRPSEHVHELVSLGHRARNHALLGAVGHSERAPIVLDLAGDRAVRWSRGRTFMCVWEFAPASEPRPTQAGAWRLELADVEGVM
jgi:hypothetical protein